MREVLLYFALKYNGDFGDILEALQRKEKVDQELKKDLFKNLKCNFITLLDDEYPSELKEVSAPPVVLFYYGNINLLHMKKVAYIGTEHYSEESAFSTVKYVKELVKKGFCLISGFNVGINRLVHKEVINNDGYSIAILSGGIDKCSQITNQDIYEEMKDHQLIISEYPFEVEAILYLFSNLNDDGLVGQYMPVVACHYQEILQNIIKRIEKHLWDFS